MNTTDNGHSAIISMNEYNEFLALKESSKAQKDFKDALRKEVLEDVNRFMQTQFIPSNDTYVTEKNLKGIGVLGVSISDAAVVTTLLLLNFPWYWFIIPGIIGIVIASCCASTMNT